MAIYLSSKSFRKVLKCGRIHILQILQLNLQFTPNSQDDGMVNVLHMPNSTAEVKKKISYGESWYSALQCHIRHLKLFQTWIVWHLLLCSCSFLLKIFYRIFGYWWTVVVSVGIPMDFFICLGFVNLFTFCILMIFVLCKFSQNISIIFYLFFYFPLIIVLNYEFLSTFSVWFFWQFC